jgi:hypothetical protein
MQRPRVSRIDALRSAIAGSAGASARGAAHALFEAGGRRVLPAAVQQAVRGAVEKEAARVLTSVGVLPPGASAATRMLRGSATQTVVLQTARAASRQVLRNVSAAAGAGALIDGGWAAIQAVGQLRRGKITQREALTHVAREAGTGAASTAAGVAAAALLVAMTGGVAAPAVFLVGAAASLGAKVGLDAWLNARARGAIIATPVSTSAT